MVSLWLYSKTVLDSVFTTDRWSRVLRFHFSSFFSPELERWDRVPYILYRTTLYYNLYTYRQAKNKNRDGERVAEDYTITTMGWHDASTRSSNTKIPKLREAPTDKLYFNHSRSLQNLQPTPRTYERPCPFNCQTQAARELTTSEHITGVT